jgi:hypothetical protein
MPWVGILSFCGYRRDLYGLFGSAQRIQNVACVSIDGVGTTANTNATMATCLSIRCVRIFALLDVVVRSVFPLFWGRMEENYFSYVQHIIHVTLLNLLVHFGCCIVIVHRKSVLPAWCDLGSGTK